MDSDDRRKINTPKRINKMIVSVLALLLSLTICATFLMQLWKKYRSKNSNSMRKRMFVAAAVISFGLLLAHSSHILLIVYGDAATIAIGLSFVFYAGYIISGTAYYVFMVFRLSLVFKDSVYEMPSKHRKLHYALCAFFLTFFIAAGVLYELTRQHAFFYGFCAVAFAALLIGLCHLVYTFNANLLALILWKRHSDELAANELPSPIARMNSNTSSQTDAVAAHSDTASQQSGVSPSNRDLHPMVSITETFNQRQLGFFNTIIKHSLLGGVMIFSLLLYALIFAALLVVELSAGDDNRRMQDNAQIVNWWSQLFCTSCVVMCIFLGFNEHSKWYRRFCGVCDRHCGSFCEYYANRRGPGDPHEFDLRAVPEQRSHVFGASAESEEEAVEMCDADDIHNDDTDMDDLNRMRHGSKLLPPSSKLTHAQSHVKVSTPKPPPKNTKQLSTEAQDILAAKPLQVQEYGSMVTAADQPNNIQSTMSMQQQLQQQQQHGHVHDNRRLNDMHMHGMNGAHARSNHHHHRHNNESRAMHALPTKPLPNKPLQLPSTQQGHALHQQNVYGRNGFMNTAVNNATTNTPAKPLPPITPRKPLPVKPLPVKPPNKNAPRKALPQRPVPP